MSRVILSTILLSLFLTACEKKAEEAPHIPVIVTNSNNVQSNNMTPLPPPVPIPTSALTPTQAQPAQVASQDNSRGQGNVDQGQSSKKIEFTPVVSRDYVPPPPPPLNTPKIQFDPNTIPAPTIADLGDKTEVTYYGAKQVINGKFINIERKPEGFLIVTKTNKYFLSY